MQRVHLVTEPLSDYMQYELAWSYPPNVAAGEDIRILAVSDRDPLLREPDYWLFDSRVLVEFRYDDGRLDSARLISDPAAIVRANWLRDMAMHAAVPLREYLTGHDALQRRAS